MCCITVWSNTAIPRRCATCCARIRLLRSRAAEFGLKPDRIGVVGASAGGHLAASAETLYDDPDGKTGAELDKVSARPDFAVLLYPVITMKDPYAHALSRKDLLGATPTPEAIDHLSLELHVTKDTPPTFIVQTEEDKTVPVENSLMFYQALRTAASPPNSTSGPRARTASACVPIYPDPRRGATASRNGCATTAG